MIWGSISADGPKEFLVFNAESINGDIYREEVVPLKQKAAL